jgi:phenylacetate-CoA ligase
MIDHFLTGLSLIQTHVNQWLPFSMQRRFAEKRIIRQVCRAYRSVPYYKIKYDKKGVDISSIRTLKDLKKLPFLTKNEVREQFPEGIVAKGVDRKRCHFSATTGSTGKSLPFLYSPATYAFYLATSVRVYTMIGFRPWHKSVYIKYTPVSSPGLGPFFRKAHIPSINTAQEQIEKLKKESPDLLIGYASIILEIAQNVTKEDLRYIKPKFISVNSEISTMEQRSFISDVFSCPVFDEYSTEETWMIASQCSKQNYHLFTDNVWVEFLDNKGNDVPSGEIGEMVITTMRSPAMPFLRYKIGDLGRYSDKKCSCNIGFPLLETFEGRSDDSFILPSGKIVSSLKILNTFTMFIKKYLHLMEEFKVIQKKKELVVIELVKGKEFNGKYFQELVDKLHVIFDEPVTILVEMVDKIPTNGSVKRKAIESWVKKPD